MSAEKGAEYASDSPRVGMVKRAMTPLSATNGFLGSVPMAARVVALVGVPGTIALFLVWMMSSTLPKIAQDVLLNRIATERAQQLQQDALQKQEELLRMMQRICVNVAKDDEGRQRCFTK